MLDAGSVCGVLASAPLAMTDRGCPVPARKSGRSDRPRTLPGPGDPARRWRDLAAGKLTIVDLTWPLNATAPTGRATITRPFELHTIATLEKDGVLSKAFSTPEHLGTHIDAPNHFERERPSVDQIPPAAFVRPGRGDRRAPAVSVDADYLVVVDDVRRFEADHGRIPEGAVVLAYTGWSQFWDQSGPLSGPRRDGPTALSRLLARGGRSS